MFGGLVVLQSSAGIDVAKVAYFSGCILAFGIAFIRSRRLESVLILEIMRPFLLSSLAWILLVAGSFAVAMNYGSTPINWMRDSIPYLLIAAIPFSAMDMLVDLQRKPQSRLPMALFLLFGALTTIGFSANWIARRGYAELGIEGLFFSTFIFPCALFSFAAASALSSNRQRTMWALMAALVFMLPVLTGTRTSLVMLTAPAAVLIGQGANAVRHLPRIVGLVASAGVLGIVTFITLPQYIDMDVSVIVDRFSSITEITSDSYHGQSFDERSIVTSLTLESLRQSPLFGIGPGHIYEWAVPYNDEIKTGFVVDSPFGLAAKFGLLGMLVYLFTLGAIYRFQRALHRAGDAYCAERDAIRGFLAVIVVLSLIGSPLDDKGFSFAIAFLLLLGLQRVMQLDGKALQRAP
jgi:hypothetical protein